MYTRKSNYGDGQSSYSDAPTSYKATYQHRQKRTLRYLGCTCGGNSPCRGTCRTFVTE